jgi:hypothetical protein
MAAVVLEEEEEEEEGEEGDYLSRFNPFLVHYNHLL